MSEFWLQKMKTYFKRIDFDRDGSITRNDFVRMADSFKTAGKLEGEPASQLLGNLTKVWDDFLKPESGGEGMSEDAFIKTMSKLVHNPDLKPTLQGPLPLFFGAVDANNDGLISQEEFSQYFELLGVGAAAAPESFKAIDDNNDGQISLDEFVHNGSEFFLEENDQSKPSKLFWGPLV